MKFIRVAGTILVLHFVAEIVAANPVHLRTEYLENPLGIDAIAPRLSWQSDNTDRNWTQSAYEILVATQPGLLRTGAADIWDSGRVSSAESVGVAYGGPKVQSRHRYYWTVRVWDGQGHASEYATAAWWEMGLLAPSDWSSQWIHWNNPDEGADKKGMNWIWVAGRDALHVGPETTVAFRLNFNVPNNTNSAALFLMTRGNYTLNVNGQEVTAKQRWKNFDRQDISDELVPGQNAIEVTLTTPKPGADAAKGGPAGIVGQLKITQQGGTVARIPTDGKWEGRMASATDWQPAAVVAAWTDPRFGDVPAMLPQPAALLRREIRVTKEVRSARLYVTALGSYRFFVNGERVGEDVLTPEYTDYRKRVLYQTYDVGKLLKHGDNALAAMLGDGWFGSSFTWDGSHTYSGPDRLLAQLEVNYADGSLEKFVTDNTWKAAPSPIVHSEIYAGETYDARLLQTDWDHAGFADKRWAAAVASGTPTGLKVVASTSASRAKVVMTIQPKSFNRVADGSYVFDMGQNMVGWVKLRASGPAGTSVRLRYAEIVNPDGSIYRQNLRNADATDRYILRGKGVEEFTPQFTFHGFRYVEVRGYPGLPGADAIEGQVVSSLSGQGTATLSTSSDLVNRMWAIGLWGQRGNFVTVPTDCPQRDERLGWMGDAGVFWRTGTYNFDIAAFSEKWMNDVNDAQTPEGAFTNVSPNMLPGNAAIGAPGWGDAGVIVPYTTWLQYGDKRVINEHWDAMQQWMDFIAKANPDFIRKNGVGPNYADWLAPDSGTPKDLISTAYWALIATQMIEMARATARDADVNRYTQLLDSIRAAYQKAYINSTGEVLGGTQSAYLLTLYMKLAPAAQEPTLTTNLVNAIHAKDDHLSTGFLGTPFLLFVLGDHGRADVAYQLLLNDTYPSWGYMLSKGATTWWERWNGDTGDPAMNSYNHYAFGSVVAWVYRRVVGIDTVTAAPGFHEIVIHALPDERITQARGEYDSVYGKISSEWSGSKSGPFTLKITVPANSAAQVFVPSFPNAQVYQDGIAVTATAGIQGDFVRVGSGTYVFTVK